MWPLSAARAQFGDHPHALRTWVRSRLPFFLLRMGAAGFGRDCESIGAIHNWHNLDNVRSRCIFCGQEREGQLWQVSPYAGATVWHDLNNVISARRKGS